MNPNTPKHNVVDAKNHKLTLDLVRILRSFAIEIPWLFQGNNPLTVQPFADSNAATQAAQTIASYVTKNYTPAAQPAPIEAPVLGENLKALESDKAV